MFRLHLKHEVKITTKTKQQQQQQAINCLVIKTLHVMFFVAFCSHDESKSVNVEKLRHVVIKLFLGVGIAHQVEQVTKCDKNIAETCVRVNPEAIYCKFLVSIKAKKPKKK